MVTLSTGNLSSYSYTYYATVQSSNGKIALPVQPSQVVYTQLEHIKGYAFNSDNSGGVSINKLHLLDALISQAIEVKCAPQDAKNYVQNYSEGTVDKLINKYQQEIHTAFDFAKRNPYALAPYNVQGALFSLSA